MNTNQKRPRWTTGLVILSNEHPYNQAANASYYGHTFLVEMIVKYPLPLEGSSSFIILAGSMNQALTYAMRHLIELDTDFRVDLTTSNLDVLDISGCLRGGATIVDIRTPEEKEEADHGAGQAVEYEDSLIDQSEDPIVEYEDSVIDQSEGQGS